MKKLKKTTLFGSSFFAATVIASSVAIPVVLSSNNNKTDSEINENNQLHYLEKNNTSSKSNDVNGKEFTSNDGNGVYFSSEIGDKNVILSDDNTHYIYESFTFQFYINSGEVNYDIDIYNFKYVSNDGTIMNIGVDLDVDEIYTAKVELVSQNDSMVLFYDVNLYNEYNQYVSTARLIINDSELNTDSKKDTKVEFNITGFDSQTGENVVLESTQSGFIPKDSFIANDPNKYYDTEDKLLVQSNEYSNIWHSEEAVKGDIITVGSNYKIYESFTFDIYVEALPDAGTWDYFAPYLYQNHLNEVGHPDSVPTSMNYTKFSASEDHHFIIEMEYIENWGYSLETNVGNPNNVGYTFKFSEVDIDNERETVVYDEPLTFNLFDDFSVKFEYTDGTMKGVNSNDIDPNGLGQTNGLVLDIDGSYTTPMKIPKDSLDYYSHEPLIYDDSRGFWRSNELHRLEVQNHQGHDIYAEFAYEFYFEPNAFSGDDYIRISIDTDDGSYSNSFNYYMPGQSQFVMWFRYKGMAGPEGYESINYELDFSVTNGSLWYAYEENGEEALSNQIVTLSANSGFTITFSDLPGTPNAKEYSISSADISSEWLDGDLYLYN